VQFGLCTISNRDESAGTVVERAAEAGYDGVEIWGKDPHIGDGSPERCEAIRSDAADHTLTVGVYGSYLRPGTERFDDERDHELAVARRLGADVIRVWAGDDDYEERTEAQWEAAVADLRELVDAAADEGLAVTVEHHRGTLTSSAEGARRLIEAVDHENCGLNWQPSFQQAADEVLAEARDLAPLSNNLHVQAVPEPDIADRCLLADAHFDLPAILAVFDDAGFDGWVDVEFVTSDVDYETAIAGDLEYLRSIRDEL